MSIMLLLYGIQTPEADAPPTPPTPTPDTGSGGGPISGGNPNLRRFPIIIFNKRINRDDEDLILMGDL